MHEISAARIVCTNSNTRRYGMKRGWLKYLAVGAGLYLLPCLATLVIRKNIPETDMEMFDSGIIVYIDENGGAEPVDLEAYLVGVVAAQLPADRQPGNDWLEALKCQAVLARTQAMRAIGSKTETAAAALNLNYFSDAMLRETYGSGYEAGRQALVKAVTGTAEEVLTCEGELAVPAYFFCSNGRTRSAEDVWGSAIACLSPVDSSADTTCENYRSEVTMTVEECIARLQKTWTDFEAAPEGFKDTVQILQKDGSGYVTHIQMGNRAFTGEEVRRALGLNSASFEVRAKSKTITFEVTGVGHGVGMSQWGAREMALEGKGYREILEWYFPGAQVMP